MLAKSACSYPTSTRSIINLSPHHQLTNRTKMLKHLSVLLSLSLLVLFAKASLVSEVVHKELTSTISTRARALGIPRSQEACLLREASSFRPVMKESGAMYDIVKYRLHVVEAMKTCMPDQLTTGTSIVHTFRPRRVRRKRCGCRSNCHFCCVVSAFGGDDLCFKLHCKRAVMLGKTQC